MGKHRVCSKEHPLVHIGDSDDEDTISILRIEWVGEGVKGTGGTVYYEKVIMENSFGGQLR